MKTLTTLIERLEAHHKRTQETPLFNPVFQLSLDLSRRIESGELSLDDCSAMIAELEAEALQNRADRLDAMLAPIAPDDNHKALQAILDEQDFDSANFENSGFDNFASRWQKPQLHSVFTAHPTFLMSPVEAAEVAQAASQQRPVKAVASAEKRPAITLEFEHDQAMIAIANAQSARDVITGKLLTHAAEKWPEKWLKFAPLPFRFASWVGYDMDGRTDISWSTSIYFRLSEKAQRLGLYTEHLAAIDGDHPLLEALRPAAVYAAERAQDFAGDLSDPAALSLAANRLSAKDPHRILSLKPAIALLEQEAEKCANNDDVKRAIQLKTLACAMRADGLGMGWIHFRVNAKQLHNAIRRRLDPTGMIDLSSKSAMVHLRRAIDEVQPLSSNFGALAIEASTAIRQFLAMAQILKCVDADAPIRMLIAECEEPATMLSALYFAKLFGIEDHVDVSPLFETESALEHGGRFLDELLREPAYRAYAKKRGRVAIQAGFSDAGRFVGQIPASLAIERLQGRLAKAMSDNGLSDCSALIFNTHGESMGRGAHPSSMADRISWPLSPWAKQQFARANITLEPEVSFQGGDGYLWFASHDLALATLTRITEAQSPQNASPNGEGGDQDPFYNRTDLSLDFYRAIRDHQHDHLQSRSYARALTAFGLGMLNGTGSRVSRRQSNFSADREMSLRSIRAIPHNSVLQQLGYPVNVIAGIGSAAHGNYDEIAELLKSSARGQQLVRLVRHSNSLASVKTLAAFGELFNSAFWASRPYRGTEGHLNEACGALAEYLIKDDRVGVFRRLASVLRVDSLKFDRLNALLPKGDNHDRNMREIEDTRQAIGVMQALRLALFQHMFIRAVSVPPFSRANDVSRDDVLEMVFTLRIDEAMAQLRRAYPAHSLGIDNFELSEPSDYPDGKNEGYEMIRRDFIDPIEYAYRLSLRISAAIAHEFGAHG